MIAGGFQFLIAFGLFIFFVLASGNLEASSKDKKLREIEIRIKGGVFEPDVLALNYNERVRLVFLKEDDSLCKEKVFIKGLSEEIPLKLGIRTTREIVGRKVGRHHMECETGAFCGVIFVSEDPNNPPKHYYVPHPE